jgi:hypothetical protein
MTAPAFFRKELGVLRPANAPAEAAMQKIKLGSEVRVEIKRPRNIRHHKKFFAMLKIVFENQEHYQSMDVLLGVCKLATGWADVVQTKHGTVGLPKSIAFHKMNAEQFEQFYERAVDWVAQEVIPGLQRGDLDESVERELLNFGG